MSSGVIRAGATPSYKTHETMHKEKKFARYIHSDDMLLPSLHPPHNLFIREVQTRLIVGCI